jgi:hypothetical protein
MAYQDYMTAPLDGLTAGALGFVGRILKRFVLIVDKL